jgi:hypothetical protein
MVRALTDLGLSMDLVDHVSSFVGGCGIVGGDLRRFSKQAKLDGGIEVDRGAPIGEFIHALTDRSLSFMLALTTSEEYDGDIWPRTAQLIMLNQRADLVGALMNFDLAACSCAYDGVGVQITPRAEFSLQTLVNVVTPFCLEERRNRKRIVKYYRRGFIPVVVDPELRHYHSTSALGARREAATPSWWRMEVCGFTWSPPVR